MIVDRHKENGEVGQARCPCRVSGCGSSDRMSVDSGGAGERRVKVRENRPL